jgi:hypothetical protein
MNTSADSMQILFRRHKLSIKRHLSKRENVNNHIFTELYAAVSSPMAMEQTEHLLLLLGKGPGSTASEPLALVVLDSLENSAALETKYIHEIKAILAFSGLSMHSPAGQTLTD